MNKYTLFFVAFLSVGVVRAQQFELGKVSKDELSQTSHPLEPDAPAAILFENGASYMEFSESKGFMLTTEVDVRIKIYKKEGYDWANKTIAYYVAQNPVENVNVTKAVTYNLVNGSIEKTKLKSEGEFDEKVNKFWKHKKITMPNVKEGSVIEFRYMISSPYLNNVPKWTFQTSIPVNYSKYVTRFPQYYIYKNNLKGFIQPSVTTSVAQRRQTLTSKERTTTGQVTSTSFSSDAFEYNENITTYVAQNMPSMKDEAYVSNIGNYLSSVEHELSVINMPNQGVKTLSVTWEDLAKTIYDSSDFGPELNKTGYFEDDLKPLIAKLPTNEEKIAGIFNHVKNHMNWNAFRGYTCDDGVRKAYKDKVGNSAEINLMLTAMLRYAGITANPVLVSTRDNGIAFFPNRQAYNYVICAVEAGDGVVLLDATDKYALPNIIPVRALNWSGRIIRPDGTSALVDLMPVSNSKDIVNMIASVDAQGKFSGKIRDQYYDHNALIYRQNFSKASKDSYVERLEKRLAGMEIGDDFTVVSDDFSKPVTESYSFMHDNASEIIGDKIYFSPLVFFAEKENPFKQDKREYPVDFVFPHQDKYALTINLPEGYAVESIPEPAAISMGNLGKFTFHITSNEKQIQISAVKEINEAIVGSQDYEMLKNFYKAMIDKTNEKIILKKI